VLTMSRRPATSALTWLFVSFPPGTGSPSCAMRT